MCGLIEVSLRIPDEHHRGALLHKKPNHNDICISIICMNLSQ